MKLAVDIVVFTIRDQQLRVLLIERGIPPYKGRLALPGGFVKPDESLEDAARRELAEETGVKGAFLEQLYTFGDPRRDPRGRVVSVAYYALVPWAEAEGGSDAAAAGWRDARSPGSLAFDHSRIVGAALERLRGKLGYTNVGFELLPDKFTMTELQTIHEAILGAGLDKRNFRRKVEQAGIVRALNEWRSTGRRPAQLYRFAPPRRQ